MVTENWEEDYEEHKKALGLMTAAAIMALSATAAFAGLEFNACNWTSAPHFNLPGLVKDAGPRKSLLADLKARNLELMALNANGNQLHPLDGKRQSDDLYDTIRVAGDLGVKTVVCMSSLPGGAAGEKLPNWVVSSWPPETRTPRTR